MPGGSITVSNGAGDALSVTITGGTWKANANLSGGIVSFPDAITATKTYYTGSDTPGVVVSVKRRGVEVAGTPDGTRTVNVNDGKNLTFAPGPDISTVMGAAEVIEPTANAFRLPVILLDGNNAQIEPPAGVFALAVDADDELAFFDGTNWVKVSLVGHTHT